MDHDPTTGEAREPRRRKRELTPDERRVRDERLSLRRMLFVALEALSPALVHESDPPLRDLGGLRDVSRARYVVPLLELPRLSGQGLPGSALNLSERDYDGAAGGDEGPYALLCMMFHDGSGFRCRTRGTKILRSDLRPLATALARLADDLDARDAGTATP